MTAASIVRRPNDLLVERLVLPVEIGGASFAAAASCTVTVDTNANMADGDTVTLNDGTRIVIYEYDKSSNGIAAGHVSWAAGAGTAAQGAATLKTAILANQPLLDVTDNLDGTLTIKNKLAGSFGNTTNSKSSSSALAVTNFTGGQGGQGSSAGISATETVKIWSPKRGGATVDRVWLNCPAGFAADASNYWTLALKDGSTTLASWTTHSTGEGALTADTPVDMTIAANVGLAAADNLTLVATKTGSPANFPAARVVAELLYGG